MDEFAAHFFLKELSKKFKKIKKALPF